MGCPGAQSGGGILARRQHQERRGCLGRELGAELRCDVGEPAADRGGVPQDHSTRAGAQSGRSRPRLGSHIDPKRPPQFPLEGDAEADPGESREPRGGGELELEAELARRRQGGASLGQVVDGDREPGDQPGCCASARIPGSSLPSSHSRKAPPAVET